MPLLPCVRLALRFCALFPGTWHEGTSRELTFPFLVPHTQKKSSQQRKQIAKQKPEGDHQARGTGTEIQWKSLGQVHSWRICFWRTLLTEVPAWWAEQVSIMNPAIHLRTDREDLPSLTTHIWGILNPNLQTLGRTRNLITSTPPVWVTQPPLTFFHDRCRFLN
jgi:hypothetical protein